MIIIFAPIKRWIFGLKEEKLPSIKRIIFNIILLIVLRTALIINMLNNHSQYSHQLSDIEKELVAESNRASSIILIWQQEHFKALNMQAEQNKGCISESSTLCRTGADEFILLIPKVNHI